MTNCNPPYIRGTGCCKCCPPESCDDVRITFNLYKNNCSSPNGVGRGLAPTEIHNETHIMAFPETFEVSTITVN